MACIAVRKQAHSANAMIVHSQPRRKLLKPARTLKFRKGIGDERP
jgi:hypothetical protein